VNGFPEMVRIMRTIYLKTKHPDTARLHRVG